MLVGAQKLQKPGRLLSRSSPRVGPRFGARLPGAIRSSHCCSSGVGLGWWRAASKPLQPGAPGAGTCTDSDWDEEVAVATTPHPRRRQPLRPLQLCLPWLACGPLTSVALLALSQACWPLPHHVAQQQRPRWAADCSWSVHHTRQAHAGRAMSHSSSSIVCSLAE